MSDYTLAQKIKILVETNFSNFDESNSEYACYCPFHHNVDTPALYINKKTGLWHCWNEACARKGHIGVLAEHFKMDLGIRKVIVSDISSDELIRCLTKENEVKVDTWNEALDRVSLDYNNPNDILKLDYLIKRGFHPSILEHFEIGFSDKQEMLVIPTRNDAFKIVGFIGRAIDDERKPKYRYSDGFPRSTLLFNLNNAKFYPDVYITEGSLDAIKVHQAGFPNVVSTLGSNINPGQIDLINKYFNEITVLSDNDTPGDAMRKTLCDSLAKKRLFVVKYPEGIKDPGEMNDDGIRNLIQNKINYLDYIFETTFIKEKTK